MAVSSHVSMLFVAMTALVLASTVQASDFDDARQSNWHQWRGPDATGVAPHADPPIEWDATTNLKWKAAIPGHGKSSPIVWKNKVFITTAVNTNIVDESVAKPEDQPKRTFGIVFPNTLFKFVVICVDRESGKVVWERTAVEELPNEGHHGDNSHASASPFTDGEHLYVSFGSRGMYCYDLEGNLKWKEKLDDVSTRLSFGEASSPVASDGIVILNRDNETHSRIIAFDAEDGHIRWEKPREEISAWATPLIVKKDGRTQVITNANKRVRSYDLQTGDLLWECGGQVSNVTPSPVVFGDSVICMSGYRGSAGLALPLNSDGDITDSDKIVWSIDHDTPYVPSPLLYGNKLYFNKLNNGVLTCLDAASGKPLMEATRLQGVSNIYASPVGAADRLYFVGRDGTTVVLKNSPTLEILASNKLDESIDASPAVVDNQIILRGQNHLYCFQK